MSLHQQAEFFSRHGAIGKQMFQDRVSNDFELRLVEACTLIDQVGTESCKRVFHTTSLVENYVLWEQLGDLYFRTLVLIRQAPYVGTFYGHAPQTTPVNWLSTKLDRFAF